MTIFSQNTILPIWPNDIPNAIKTDEKEEVVSADIVRIAKVQVPQIEVYLPAKKNATGQAVLIFPGGGYGILAYDWEGTDIAKFLNGKEIKGIFLSLLVPFARNFNPRHLSSFFLTVEDAELHRVFFACFFAPLRETTMLSKVQ